MALLLALAGCVFGLIALVQAQRALSELAALRVQSTPRPPPLPAGAVEPLAAEPSPPPLTPEIPPVPPPLLPEAAPAPVRAPINIELLLTQRWGVWLGAAALLLAGVFLVRVAVERGWLGPATRCTLAALLGLALIAAARWLQRRPSAPLPFADHAPAGLAAGGVAILFAASYGAGPLYGLIPELLAFVLLGAVGVAGLALSLVFGPLVAAVGLVASFATPLLVQTQAPSIPGLFAYLLAISAASWAVVRLTAWTWLGWAAALAGAFWVFIAAGMPGHPGIWAAGLFIPAAAALTLALLPAAAIDHPVGRRFAWAPMLMLGTAGLVLVAGTGDATVRLGLLLLAPIAMLKAWREPRIAWLPMVTAALGVLTLLLWAVPAWNPTGEAVTIEGVVQAVLPGAWLPEAVVPFLETAAAFALLHAAAGLWGERRTPNPLPWAALTAGVPVLLLAMTYAQVGRLQSAPGWALVAALLAAGLVAAAAAARRAQTLPLARAGVHAAGAVAALALGCAIVLDTAWLTVSLALILPALAWIEAAAGLPPLRRVALVAACVVLARLGLNPWVAGYDFGDTPILNLLLAAYGIPAFCFALAARKFRRRADDTLVELLEAGACAFTALLLVFEVYQAGHGGRFQGYGPSLAEIGWQVCLLGGFALLLHAAAGQRRILAAAFRIIGGVALAGATILLLVNPLWSGSRTTAIGLIAAYLLPAALAITALARGIRPRWLLGAYGLLALLMASVTLIRQAFHPGAIALWASPVEDAELWTVSGVWLAMAACVLVAGIGLGRRPLRLVGLGLVALVAAKVFLVDMAGLQGLWRVVSFLGLGLSLIGLSAFYRRFASVGSDSR